MRLTSLLRTGLLCCGMMLAAALSSAGGKPPTSSKDQKQVCIDAYSSAQKLRREGKLRAARQQMVVCAQDSCPSVSRSDCSQWLTEVDQTIPTLVLIVKDEKGQDTTHVQVSVDGEAIADRIEGKAIQVDPGEHSLALTCGGKTIEQKIVVHEAERARTIAVSFAPVGKGPEAASSGAVPVAAAPAVAAAPPDRPTPLPVYVLGGAGVAALGGFTAFAISGRAKENSMRTDPCSVGDTCLPSDADTVKQRYLIADIFLGAGVLSLGAATVLYFTRPSRNGESSRPPIDIVAMPGGTMVRVGGAF